MSDESGRYTAREEVLTKATEAVMRARNNVYGPPTQDFDRAAGVLNALGFRVGDRAVQSHDIAMIQMAVKLSRLTWTPNHEDSWVDLAGYAACGYECSLAEPLVEVVEAAPAADPRVPVGTELTSVEEMGRLAVGQVVEDTMPWRYRKISERTYTRIDNGEECRVRTVLLNPNPSSNGKPAEWARVVE